MTDYKLPRALEIAAEAVFDKKARDVVVLDLEGVCSFTDHFVLCTGASVRQTQSIADHVAAQLKNQGITPAHVEGHSEGEWILMDYVDFVLHVFTENTREFYGLERLWRSGKRIDLPEPVAHRG